jgi:putative NADH-flavin reductase
MIMRVSVFGASGGIGRLVVTELLDRGDDVVALVRTPSKLDITHERLTVITGELSDPSAIHAVVAGSEAVISALGPALTRGATGTPVTDGTRSIVAAMDAAGVLRYVGLATPSVPDPQDLPTVTGRIIPLMARVFLPNALAELQA